MRRPELLGNWLVGVAVRVGGRARRAARRRLRREVSAVNAPEPAAPETAAIDAGPELYEELDRLPAWYRDAILLCDLQGVSRVDAARRLGVPEGTVSSRLAGGRKRLADALARRGVALTAALVPAALGAGPGAAAVPDDLLNRTCGLVADWAAGGAVPGPVVRLAEGGFSMRQVMLAGACGLVLASAGAMVVGRPAGPPKPDDPGPKVVQPAVKAEPKADEPRYAAKPRLTRIVDSELTRIHRMAWSPDGAVLVVEGQLVVRGDDGRPVKDQPPGTLQAHAVPPGNTAYLGLKSHEELVGFTPDGRHLVTAQREYGLVSGRHQLVYWDAGPNRRMPAVIMERNRTVDLDADSTFYYAFAADGKTFRTVHRDLQDGEHTRLEVLEVDAATGRTRRPVLTVDGKYQSFALSADGNRLATMDRDGVVGLWDVPAGRKLWGRPVPPAKRDGDGTRAVKLSATGRWVVGYQGRSGAALFDGSTGDRVPLDGADSIAGSPDPSFSHDGRLLALSGGRQTGRNFLTVWDTATGRVVKSWDGFATTAFHPAKPVLAVVEANGDGTRLGVWDFAAEKP